MDPLSNTIVAKGVADPAHPLKHAVMVAVDNVATSQGGGAWNRGTASLLQKDVNTGGLLCYSYVCMWSAVANLQTYSKERLKQLWMQAQASALKSSTIQKCPLLSVLKNQLNTYVQAMICTLQRNPVSCK